MTAASEPPPAPAPSATAQDARPRKDNPRLGVLLIVIGMFCISINDMTIKRLSGDYPLHQLVFIRSAIGIAFSLVILQFEGGLRALKTDRPGLHIIRGLCIVFSNMTFFAAIAVLPLADATALFFVAPLLITLLSIPMLGEQVGPRRLAAVAVGFLGVLAMTQPAALLGLGGETFGHSRWLLALPVLAALGYAAMQVLTRRLGASSPAAAMAVYIQGMFLAVGLAFFLVAGDGRFVEGVENESLQFLLRAWRWPEADDWSKLLLLGLMSGAIGYALSQAYRVAAATTVAPFEYVALPFAIFWGWAIFGSFPGPSVLFGIALIAGSGIYVFWREGRRSRVLASGEDGRRAP